MGNTPSNNATTGEKRPPAAGAFTNEQVKPPSSPSPGPGRPHRSLRHKKGSLDLPDISLCAVGPLPIPNRPRTRKQPEAWHDSSQTIPMSYVLPPVPPPSVIDSPAIPDIKMDLTSPDRPSYEPQTVRSTLPIPLPIACDQPPDPSDALETPIVWTGAGESVVIVHTVDDIDVHTPLRREGERFVTTLSLQPGTHHITFYVDGIPQISDDLPKTVDDQSTLVNYVSVGLGYPPYSIDPIRAHNFWASEPSSPVPTQVSDLMQTLDSGWSSEIPPELVHATAAEEEYISALNARMTADSSGRGSGSTLLQGNDLPAAPGLPRHLEKQILNAGLGNSLGGMKEKQRRGRGQRSRANSVTSQTPPPEDSPRVLPVTTASGTDVGAFAGVVGMTPAVPIPGSKPEPISLPVQAVPDNDADADDSSVLPVPSHVVLNHLSTSSIRNGVIAVADTVRFRSKFITTIYYKPT